MKKSVLSLTRHPCCAGGDAHLSLQRGNQHPAQAGLQPAQTVEFASAQATASPSNVPESGLLAAYQQTLTGIYEK